MRWSEHVRSAMTQSRAGQQARDKAGAQTQRSALLTLSSFRMASIFLMWPLSLLPWLGSRLARSAYQRSMFSESCGRWKHKIKGLG